MKRRLLTPICKLFGIEHPIVQGGMAWVSEAPLVAAVSEGGGLGILGSATMEPEQIARELAEIRRLTDKPFGINISLIVPQVEDRLAVALEHDVPIIITAAGSPKKFTKKIKDAGRVCCHVVPSPKLAKKCEDAGVDCIVAEGHEAGGHISHDELTMVVLVPLVRQAVKIPIIAAGGAVDGRGLAAALALGADGLQMGTRFVAAEENNSHPVFKQLLMESTGGVVYGRLEMMARGLPTPAVKHLIHLDRTGASPEEIDKARGLGRAAKAVLEGNVEEGIFPAGLSAALINDVKPAAEIINDMMEEYFAVLSRLQSLEAS